MIENIQYKYAEENEELVALAKDFLENFIYNNQGEDFQLNDEDSNILVNK